MIYLAFLRGDIVIMRYEMTRWTVQEELEKDSEHFNGKSEQEKLDLINIQVKKRIANADNSYLMYYLRRYWNDYDQYQSSPNQMQVQSVQSVQSS